ncbi:unnamed protein product [Ostreobium quekettii]|uniref:Uncharacterized protein n=1 Tax=Ostreobium quekettii TaxID=121088 RepID=A0A8S1IS36_9CHLO|nr:unnamed protein product [Ostreobium quekettii]|eukprot:evm.model.scf_81.5 EVM.evm.TU.scf_81.5   scf_81:62080-65686(-)
MQVCALSETLLENATITQLDLSYNFIDDSGMRSIVHLLKINRNLKSLQLEGNCITSAGAASLAAVLSHSSNTGPALHRLSLRGNPLGDEGVAAIAEALRTNVNIRHLDLGRTDMGEKGIVALCAALTDRNFLEILGLEKPLVQGPKDNLMCHMALMIARAHHLSTLGLGKHSLTDSEFETLLAYGLTKNRSITSLDLRANKLSGMSGPALVRLLKECPALRDLNLSHNDLGDSGALAVAQCLPYAHQLRHLDLRGNSIREAGLASLAESLRPSAALESLLLWGNGFGPMSSQAFGDVLEALAAESRKPVMDIAPYEVDGQPGVAAVDVAS